MKLKIGLRIHDFYVKNVPHEEHDQELEEEEWIGDRTLAIATTDLKDVQSIVEQWVKKTSSTVISFE